MKIRRASIDDLAALVQLEKQFPTDRLSRASFRHLLRHGHAAILVCECSGSFAGNAVVFYRRGNARARLYSLIVDPDFQRRGIARALLAAAESDAAARGHGAMYLEVRPDNAPAIRCYQQYGYAMTQRVENFYEDGTDALRMQKCLVMKKENLNAASPRQAASVPGAPGPTT